MVRPTAWEFNPGGWASPADTPMVRSALKVTMHRSIIALTLALMLPLPGLAAEVVVKTGETLSEIAERHNIPLSRLLRLNGISDPDHVEVGRKLVLPSAAATSTASPGSLSEPGTVTVKPGETLLQIAARYDMPVSQLITLNDIKDPDQLKIGRQLLVRGSKPAPKSFTYDRASTEHVIRPGESLNSIAKGYGIALQQLVAINAITDPNTIKAGTKLRLQGKEPSKPDEMTPLVTTPATKSRATATTAASPNPEPNLAPVTNASPDTPNWRSYGPLKVNWSNWQPMGGSQVAPVLNTEGQSLYIAINCSARKINATDKEGQWQAWEDPQASFESQMISDLCKS